MVARNISRIIEGGRTFKSDTISGDETGGLFEDSCE